MWQGGFTPGGRWISFFAFNREDPFATGRICVVPSSARRATAEAWTCLTGAETWTDKPRWSPDGKLLYVWVREGSLFNVSYVGSPAIWSAVLSAWGAAAVRHSFKATGCALRKLLTSRAWLSGDHAEGTAISRLG